jgi:hypothetical protein
MHLHIACLASPLVKAQDERIVVFAFFQGREHNIFCVKLQEGMPGAKRSFMLLDLPRKQTVIQFVPASNRLCLTPCIAVRIERISELVVTFIGVRVRPFRGAQQRQAQNVVFGVVPILAIVEQTEAML